MKLSDAVNSPVTVRLPGLVLKIRTPTLKVVAEFERWVQDRVMENAKRFAAMIPVDGRKAVLEEATRIMNTISFSSPESQQLISSADGFVKFISLCATDEQDTRVPADKILEAITMESLNQLRTEIKGLMGVAEDDGDPDPLSPNTTGQTS